MVMALADGGDVMKQIVHQGRESEAYALPIARQILQALSYLHGHKIVHRDLKLENWLFYGTDDHDDAIIKLADFGLATKWTSCPMNLYCGSASYIAPEILNRRYYKGYCDLWSFGVAIFMIVSGYAPFGNDPEKIKHGTFVFSPDIPLSKNLCDFISRLLRVRCAERLTLQEALHHSWTEARAIADDRLDHVLKHLRHFSKLDMEEKKHLRARARKTKNPDDAPWRELFTHHYSDESSGTCTWKLFKTVVQDLPDHEARRVFDGCDLDRDNEIKYSEYLAAMLCKLDDVMIPDVDDECSTHSDIPHESQSEEDWIKVPKIFSPVRSPSFTENELNNFV